MRLRKTLVYIFLSGLLFSSGYAFGAKGYKVSYSKERVVNIERDTPSVRENVDFSQFWKVWDALDANYFDKSKLDPSKMVYGAIEGMVAAIGDPYTSFLPPEQNKVVQEDLQGKFSGVGIQIGFKGTQLAVIAPLPNTPADEAGIKAGDYIVGIKDEKKGIDMGTVGIDLQDAVEAIRGVSGTQVTLAMLREGNDTPLIVNVTRREIDVPSVTLTFEGDNKDIAHLKILKCAGETKGEWDKAVADIAKSKPNAIVLDLRNNPGGYLYGAVELASDFLKNGSLVTYEEEASGKRNEFKTSTNPRLTNIKTVVLINQGSASASEILAGALSEQIGVKIYGETSFGKGTIQEPRQLDDGAGLHITVAKWLTPKGNWVNGKGITPDVVTKDDINTPQDEQFQEVLRNL